MLAGRVRAAPLRTWGQTIELSGENLAVIHSAPESRHPTPIFAGMRRGIMYKVPGMYVPGTWYLLVTCGTTFFHKCNDRLAFILIHERSLHFRTEWQQNDSHQ